MFQIGFGLGTDTMGTHWYNDVIRTMFSTPDVVVYSLVAIAYQILMTIANATIIDSQTMIEFYNRVQLIIGVIMIFKLSISILQVVINPDLLTDQKQGTGKIISRIVIMLAMFTAIIPLNIPASDAPENSYNAYLNDNGLLFGTMYSLQYRILNRGTIQKLILGTNGTSKKKNSDKEAANQMASYILKSFLTKNSECPKDHQESEDEFKTYNKDTISPTALLENVNKECNVAGSNPYSFAYLPIISTICGGMVLVILIGFCIDIAIRAIKLVILRLLAPIPIISYIDPKSAQQGAFANWTKTLISTYIDLFLRLAIINFIIFLVQSIIKNGLSLPSGTSVSVTLMANVFVIVGLFYFAKKAPKFIKDALGLKGVMGNVGLSGINVGLSGIMGSAGAIRQGGTLREAMEAGYDASRAQVDAVAQGKKAPDLGTSFNSGRDHTAKILTGDPNMTGRKMSRGNRHLNAMGINTKNATAAKTAMFKAQDEAALAHNLVANVTSNGYDDLSQNDKATIENEYRKKKGLGQGPLSLAQIDDMKRESSNLATIYASNMDAKAGKIKKQYDDISGMQKKYGQERSYEARYQGQDKGLTGRNFSNRALGGLGETDELSRVQRYRTQGNGTEATPPQSSGVDFTPVGDNGGGFSGGPGPGPGPI